MTTKSKSKPITVLCVDDNPLVAEAITVQLRAVPDIQCIGCASNADELLTIAAMDCPDIVLLDYDMPGKPALGAIGELMNMCPETRVLIFSGFVQRELIDRAIDAGAWGFVAKVDAHEDLLTAIREVASGSFAFSPAVRALNGG